MYGNVYLKRPSITPPSGVSMQMAWNADVITHVNFLIVGALWKWNKTRKKNRTQEKCKKKWVWNLEMIQTKVSVRRWFGFMLKVGECWKIFENCCLLWMETEKTKKSQKYKVLRVSAKKIQISLMPLTYLTLKYSHVNWLRHAWTILFVCQLSIEEWKRENVESKL